MKQLVKISPCSMVNPDRVEAVTKQLDCAKVHLASGLSLTLEPDADETPAVVYERVCRLLGHWTD